METSNQLEPVGSSENESLPRYIQTDIGRALYDYNQYDLLMYLRDGDDANETDYLQKWTPLQFVISQRDTCEEYKLETVSMLLEYGANPYKTNIDGQNAFDTARKYGEQRILNAMRNFFPSIYLGSKQNTIV